MVALKIDYCGRQEHSQEYGSIMQATHNFSCIVPYSIHRGNPDIALGIVRS